MHTFRFLSLWETLPAVSVPSLAVASLSLPELCFAASLSFPLAAHWGWFIASWALTITHTDAHFSLHVLLLTYLCCLKPISTLLLPVPPSATESCSCLTCAYVEWLHTSSLWWAKLSLWCPKSCTRSGIAAAALPGHVCFYKAMTWSHSSYRAVSLHCNSYLVCSNTFFIHQSFNVLIDCILAKENKIFRTFS